MPWKECHVMDERLRFVARLTYMSRAFGQRTQTDSRDGSACESTSPRGPFSANQRKPVPSRRHATTRDRAIDRPMPTMSPC